MDATELLKGGGQGHGQAIPGLPAGARELAGVEPRAGTRPGRNRSSVRPLLDKLGKTRARRRLGRRTFRPLSYARRMARPGHPRRCEAPFPRSAGRPGRISESVRRAITASLGEARPPVCCYTAPTG